MLIKSAWAITLSTMWENWPGSPVFKIWIWLFFFMFCFILFICHFNKINSTCKAFTLLTQHRDPSRCPEAWGVIRGTLTWGNKVRGSRFTSAAVSRWSWFKLHMSIKTACLVSVTYLDMEAFMASAAGEKPPAMGYICWPCLQTETRADVRTSC